MAEYNPKIHGERRGMIAKDRRDPNQHPGGRRHTEGRELSTGRRAWQGSADNSEWTPGHWVDRRKEIF